MDDEQERAAEREAMAGDQQAAEALTRSRLQSRQGAVLAWPMDAASSAGPIPPPRPSCIQAAVELPGHATPVQCWVAAVTSAEDMLAARFETPAGSPVLGLDLSTGRTVDLADPPSKDWHAGLGWDFPTVRAWDPVRGEVQVATWLRGGTHATGAARTRQAADAMPSRILETPLWCRSVLPAGTPPTVVSFFDGSHVHPDGTVRSPADLGPTPWMMGCLPRGFHFWWQGVSVQADMDADPGDVAQLGSSMLESHRAAIWHPLAQLAWLVAPPGSTSRAPDGTLVVTMGRPWVLAVTASLARPTIEVPELESFHLRIHLRPGITLKKRLGLTCTLHGALRVPLVG